ncbi:MAG: undecaprenyl/decaprenyl-phosphate alpha-N-acetylglucosaminyl 1-phosphate transferase [Chitinophagaceae bacterium]|nr:MAG: undecaprenyl/decaprenyl-phosphate alpha-N-acetylglucosaminyl 1-phosphate transferase [Chitinophagaceae bacterium]
MLESIKEIVPLSYLFMFVIASLFSGFLNFLFLRFSLNLGRRDVTENEQIRWATTTKPAWGGISFFIVFLMTMSILPLFIEQNLFLNWKLLGLIGAVTIGFLVGFADDIYNTNPLVKFIGQFACANILIIFGFSIPVTPIAEINYFITTLWIVGLMNSVNMLDNMDAITASISLNIIIGGLILIALSGVFFTHILTIPMLGVAGALAGFLYYNWNPSKMYMGDSGSQFLGVFLAAISIELFWGVKASPDSYFEFIQFVLPALLFIVPLIDTTTVTIRRLAKRQSPFVGGRDHITHHFVYLGMNEKQVAIALNFISFLSVIYVYLFATYYPESWKPLYTFLSLGYFLAVFVIIQILYNIAKKKNARLNS